MSYTDFIYDPFMASLTVKKVGTAKDILKLKDITTIAEKSELGTTSTWGFSLKNDKKQQFLAMQNQLNFCTSDDDLQYTHDLFIPSVLVVKYPQYYNCKLDGDKSCLIGNIEGKCKGVKKVIYEQQLNTSDNGDWGFYNNKNGRPDSESVWAWINCTYAYDFSTYNTTKQAQLLQWIKEIYNTLKANTPRNIWIGPLGNADNNFWTGYNPYNGDEYNTFNEAKTIAENASEGANSIVVSRNDKYRIRAGSAIELRDDANFAVRAYNRKINPDTTVPSIFRTINLIYTPLTDIFNMMYETGYYAENKEENSFRTNCKYLIGDNFLNWKKDYLTFWTQSATILYENATVPGEIKSSLETIIDLPRVEKKEENSFNTFKIYLTLTYSQLKKYNELTTSTTKDDYISDLLTNLMRDREAKFLINRNPVAVTTPVVSESKIDFYTIINLDNFRTEQNTPAQFPVPGNPKLFFATAQISATISRWSPMTVMYFASKGITFSSVIGDGIYNDCKIYPLSAYEEECSYDLSSECIDKIKRFCPTSYTPPTTIATISMTSQYLFASDNRNCFCYTSGVAPVSELIAGNKAAMCFDKNCTPSMKKSFLLNDNICQEYCDKVSNWRNNPSEASQNPGAFDQNSYKRICGSTYVPLYSDQINKNILIKGIIITLLFVFLSFMYTKQLGAIWCFSLCFVTFVLFGSLTGFLTYDLAGKSQCDYSNKQPLCQSRLSKITIPNQFCTAKINCECAFDQNCGSGCICSSGVCMPRSGTRKEIIRPSKYTDITNITTILIALLIIPLIIIKLVDNTILKWSLVFLSVLACSTLLYFFSVKTIHEKTFDGPCVNCSCASDEICCEDNCCKGACLNGTCQNYITGCPMRGSPNTRIDIQSVSPGNYTLRYSYDGLEWLLSVENSVNNLLSDIKAVVLRLANPNFNFTWNYNTRNKTISGTVKNSNQEVYLSAFDLSNSSICGNSSQSYKGAPSALIIDEVYANKFIMSSTTIYSIDANAYIIPDTSFIQQNNVNRGYLGNVPCMTLTYTTDKELASVWTIIQS